MMDSIKKYFITYKNIAIIIVCTYLIIYFSAFIVNWFYTNIELNFIKDQYETYISQNNNIKYDLLEDKLEELYPAGYLFLSARSSVQVSYGSSTTDESVLKSSGSYGRPLAVRIYRKFKVLLGKTYTVSVGVATSNTNVLDPTSNIEYRIGKEFE